MDQPIGSNSDYAEGGAISAPPLAGVRGISTDTAGNVPMGQVDRWVSRTPSAELPPPANVRDIGVGIVVVVGGVVVVVVVVAFVDAAAAIVCFPSLDNGCAYIRTVCFVWLSHMPCRPSQPTCCSYCVPLLRK